MECISPMDIPKPKNKKFQTIAQYLEHNQSKSGSKKVTMNNGKISVSPEIIKWTPEEDKLLLELMRKRTLGAIRLRLWTLFHRNGGESENQKLK